jgi:flavin-dependent dehydrogenase
MEGAERSVPRSRSPPTDVAPNERFVYFAYWRDVDTPADEARVWFLELDCAAVFPNEEGLTVIVAVPHRRRLEEFRRDREAAYERLVRSLPDGPGIDDAERVSELIGRLETPNRLRSPVRPGLAFVGDAALTSDPLFGVGCGWALQGAEWLVDATAAALLDGDPRRLDRALRRYRRIFARRLWPHQLQIADYSSGRSMRLNERLVFSAASSDPILGAALEELVTRRRSPLRLLDPRLLARLVRAP